MTELDYAKALQWYCQQASTVLTHPPDATLVETGYERPTVEVGCYTLHAVVGDSVSFVLRQNLVTDSYPCLPEEYDSVEISTHEDPIEAVSSALTRHANTQMVLSCLHAVSYVKSVPGT